jgi:dolichol-phosphate mannosyltransferase
MDTVINDRPAAATMFDLTIVVPTLNERENIDPLLARLDKVLHGVNWEVIFVDDDSTDGTPEHLREVALRRPNVRLIHRIGRRGLSSACIEGMLASASPYLAVMDADLQHDERLLPQMLSLLKNDGLDIVVGSRFAEGASLGQFAEERRLMTKVATRLSRILVKADLKDPMSGYFMLRREFLDETVHNLSGKGFKILLDLFASAQRPVRFKELPFKFGARLHGRSKLDLLVSLEYLYLLADKLFGHIVPVRFIIFVLIGFTGIFIHLATLGLSFKIIEASFYISQATATVTAMTSNFFLNNMVTYRDRRLYGFDLLRGLFSFYAACAIGALVNFQLAEFLYDSGVVWPLAGVLGAVVGSVWNYGVTSTFTWRKSRSPAPAAGREAPVVVTESTPASGKTPAAATPAEAVLDERGRGRDGR